MILLSEVATSWNNWRYCYPDWPPADRTGPCPSIYNTFSCLSGGLMTPMALMEWMSFFSTYSCNHRFVSSWLNLCTITSDSLCFTWIGMHRSQRFIPCWFLPRYICMAFPLWQQWCKFSMIYTKPSSKKTGHILFGNLWNPSMLSDAMRQWTRSSMDRISWHQANICNNVHVLPFQFRPSGINRSEIWSMCKPTLPILMLGLS